MPTILFWNMSGVNDAGLVASLAHEHATDILVLAECAIPTQKLQLALNTGSRRLFFPDPLATGRITLFTTVKPLKKTESFVKDTRYCSVRQYKLPLFGSMLLVAVHLSSKTNLEGAEQSQLAGRLRELVNEAEERVGHARTVVVGDFNMNPFEDGLVGSEAMHAVSDRRVAARGSRTVLSEPRTFLYNPMWRFLGDNGPHPPGTFFHSGSSPVTHFWNVFDQVLFRPELLPHFTDDGVRIVTEIRGVPLACDKGRPDRTVGSDHLPIVLRLSDVELTEHGQELVG
jgi:hypothetical protein